MTERATPPSGGRSVSVEADGPVVTVTLTRPDQLNALPPAAHHEMSEVFDRLADDPSVRVVIVTGAGKAFCAGYDLKHDGGAGGIDIPPTGFGGLTWRADYPLPLIAAVNGVAMGGGFELALACDLIVASEEATFALPEPKVGWAALGGGAQRLPRAVGVKRAMGIILTGRRVSAAEGHELGFVNEVVAGDDLRVAAMRWASRIVECAPLAIRASKQVAYQSLDQPDFVTMMNPDTYSAVRPMFESADAKEGPRAFMEKRKPLWRGA